MAELNQDRIEKVVELAAPVSRVWRALTDHEEFGEWFRVRLDGPFEVGVLTTGQITYPGHEDVKWESVTERMEHEKLFVFSWPPSAVDPETAQSLQKSRLVQINTAPAHNVPSHDSVI